MKSNFNRFYLFLFKNWKRDPEIIDFTELLIKRELLEKLVELRISSRLKKNIKTSKSGVKFYELTQWIFPDHKLQYKN
jgi:hypothetical protein